MENLIPSANSAKQCSGNDLIIFSEVTDITRAILEARCQGVMEVQVFDTFMTSLEDTTGEGKIYYKVFQEHLDDRIREMHMNEVIKCFKKKGYSITRKTNPLTGETFLWELKW